MLLMTIDTLYSPYSVFLCSLFSLCSSFGLDAQLYAHTVIKLSSVPSLSNNKQKELLLV